MMSPRLVLLLLAFISACLLPRTWADEAGAVIDEEDEYVDAEVPQPALLVAYKNVKTPKVVQGCNVTMSISLFNVGTGTANDISVEDTLPPNFSLIEGSLKASFKYLDPGATVSMEYIGIPSVGDQKLLAKPAKVVYKTGKDKAHHLLSTSPFMEILSTRQNVELHLVNVGRTVSFGRLNTLEDWWQALKAVACAAFFIWVNFVARRHAYRTGKRRPLKQARVAKQAQHAAAKAAGAPGVAVPVPAAAASATGQVRQRVQASHGDGAAMPRVDGAEGVPSPVVKNAVAEVGQRIGAGVDVVEQRKAADISAGSEKRVS